MFTGRKSDFIFAPVYFFGLVVMVWGLLHGYESIGGDFWKEIMEMIMLTIVVPGHLRKVFIMNWDDDEMSISSCLVKH